MRKKYNAMNITRNKVINGEKSNKNLVNVSMNDGIHWVKTTERNETMMYEKIVPKNATVAIVQSTNKQMYIAFFNSKSSVSNLWIRRYKFERCFSICCSSSGVRTVELFKLVDDVERFINDSSSSGVIGDCSRQLFRIWIEKFPRWIVCLQTLHWTWREIDKHKMWFR